MNGAIAQHGGDPTRKFLTGFSYGGEGALKFASLGNAGWSKVWAVDPNPRPDTAELRLPQHVLVHYGTEYGQAIPDWIRGALPNAVEIPRNSQNWQALVQEQKLHRRFDLRHVPTCREAYMDIDAYAWLLR